MIKTPITARLEKKDIHQSEDRISKGKDGVRKPGKRQRPQKVLPIG